MTSPILEGPVSANGLADLVPHRQEWLLWRWASSLDWYGVDDLVREYAAWGCNPAWKWTHATAAHCQSCLGGDKQVTNRRAVHFGGGS